jgi:cell division inhibitor SulA
MSLEQLLDKRQDIWRGRVVSPATAQGVPTGFAALDALLPWRGWPPGSLSEILEERPGGAFALVLPVLARLSSQTRWLLLIAPPFLPYAPALAAAGLDLSRLVVIRAGDEIAWAAEQGLGSGACSAVLAWGGRWQTSALRRLQLAAETGGAIALLFRGEAAAKAHSPAALRLRVRPSVAGGEVTVLKQRGGRAGAVLQLPLYEPFSSTRATAVSLRR